MFAFSVIFGIVFVSIFVFAIVNFIKNAKDVANFKNMFQNASFDPSFAQNMNGFDTASDMHRMAHEDAMRMHAQAHTDAMNLHNIAHNTAVHNATPFMNGLDMNNMTIGHFDAMHNMHIM